MRVIWIVRECVLYWLVILELFVFPYSPAQESLGKDKQELDISWVDDFLFCYCFCKFLIQFWSEKNWYGRIILQLWNAMHTQEINCLSQLSLCSLLLHTSGKHILQGSPEHLWSWPLHNLSYKFLLLCVLKNILSYRSFKKHVILIHNEKY